MKITDTQFIIKTIQAVTESTNSNQRIVCQNRYSDCFAYVFSGKAAYDFNGKKIIAEEGDIIYLSRGSNYKINIESPSFSTIFIDFFFDKNDNIVLENNIFKGNRIKSLDNTFIKLKRLWSIGNFSDKIYSYSLLYRIYSDIVFKQLFAYMPTSNKLQLENAINLISEKYSCADFSIKELAESCNLSEAHFRRLFMQIYHTSPRKFITSYRLEKAKQLLTQSNISINQICKLCGFVNAYYFSRVFKADIGMTPSEYKKTQRNLL